MRVHTALFQTLGHNPLAGKTKIATFLADAKSSDFDLRDLFQKDLPALISANVLSANALASASLCF